MSSATDYVEPATYNNPKLSEMGGQKEIPQDTLLLANIFDERQTSRKPGSKNGLLTATSR